MNKPISVAIVDDSADLRENIGGYLEMSAGFRCAHRYATAEDALEGLCKTVPDVVLMDINLGKGVMDGIDCVRRLKAAQPKVQIMMLTVFEDSEKIFRALAAGASGYLLKRMPPAELLDAIREVMAGGAPMSTSIALKVVQSFQTSAPHQDESAQLSQREREVLSGLAKGLAYKQIADQLNVSIHTVRNYIRRIYEKLHVRSRTEAVAKFMAH
ncbi:MAG TPA: response regulator transcription factor [Candidatus Dormibacteraeota bacterium]|nr:response regulator transcription factor [Candidatus Dormibacteraeota bacterium]